MHTHRRHDPAKPLPLANTFSKFARVLTTQGGIAGIGLGHQHGTEHDSTPQSVRVVLPSGRHSAVAVPVRKVVQLAGRLLQEKVRKECPCVVSGSARCTTVRDEDGLGMFLGETQTMCFVT